jgi:VCBS repeat-containing protein
LADVFEGLYGDLTIGADGQWTYQLTNFDLPFDEAMPEVYDTFSMQTLGGDLFNIDVIIQQDGFLLG